MLSLPGPGISFLASGAEDIEEYSRSVRNEEEVWIFRGQGANVFPQPRYFRAKMPKSGLVESERVCLDKTRAELGVGCDCSRVTDWDLLTSVQHHGGPTRLLDWTQNLPVAIFFAAMGRLREISAGVPFASTRNAVVWLLKTRKEQWLDLRSGLPALADIQGVSFFRPNDIDLRVIAQDSVFSVHPIPKSSLDLALGGWPNSVDLRNKGDIISIAFDDEALTSVFDWLKEAKLTDQSIYPDPTRIVNHWFNSYEALPHLRTVRSSVGIPWRASVK